MAPKVAFSYLFAHITTKQFLNWKCRCAFEKLLSESAGEKSKNLPCTKMIRGWYKLKNQDMNAFFNFNLQVENYLLPVPHAMSFGKCTELSNDHHKQNTKQFHQPPPLQILGLPPWSQAFPLLLVPAYHWSVPFPYSFTSLEYHINGITWYIAFESGFFCLA